MAFLNKLPNSTRYPHGMEWKILKKTPWLLFYSANIIAIFTAVAHIIPPDGTAAEISKHLDFVNIIAIAILVASWLIILTVAFGAFVVYLMKGPAYAWDPLEVVDSEEPDSH